MATSDQTNFQVYYFTLLNLQRAVLKCTDKMIRLDKNVEKQEAEELLG